MKALIERIDGLINNYDKQAFEKAAANIIHSYDLENEGFEPDEIAGYLTHLIIEIANNKSIKSTEL